MNKAIKNIKTRIEKVTGTHSGAEAIGAGFFICAGVFFMTHIDKIHPAQGIIIFLGLGALLAFASVVHQTQGY